MRQCEVSECVNVHSSRGMCRLHYQRWRRYGDPLAEKPAIWKPTKPKIKCVVESCTREARTRGACDGHYQRLKKYGSFQEDKPLKVHDRSAFESQDWNRTCPQCGEVVPYRPKSQSFYQARRRNSLCGKCRCENSAGEGNPFFGKIHTDITRKTISEKRRGQHNSPSTEFVNGQPTINRRPVYEWWVEKYGAEEADRRKEELRKVQSKNSSGSNNPMFGRPSPGDSGVGWSGWYKGFFFRSLRELSYIVNVLEPGNHRFISGETSSFQVLYIDWKGTQRTYHPDFIVDDVNVVECKPVKLHHTPTVLAKSEAATRHFEMIGMSYCVIDPPPIDNDMVFTLWSDGSIVWTPKYETKFKEEYGTNFDFKRLARLR